MTEPRRSGRPRRTVRDPVDSVVEVKPKPKPKTSKGKKASKPAVAETIADVALPTIHSEALVDTKVINEVTAGSSNTIADLNLDAPESAVKAQPKKRGRSAGSKTSGTVTKKPRAEKKEGEDEPKPKKKGRAKKVDPNAERNARVEISGCSPKMFSKFKRAIGQRMFMVDRTRIHDTHEEFKILGSTGNVYTTRISSQPKCDCPDYLFNGRTICKHTIFVLIRVFKVPDESDVWYQPYLTSEQVQDIFANAPANPQDSVDDPSLRKAWRVANGLEVAEEEPAGPSASGEVSDDAVKQKHQTAIGEDCPVCYEEITADEVEEEKLIFDESSVGCGKPLHKQCFDMWAQTATSKGLPVTCVWCRATWPIPGGASSSQSGYGKARIPGQTYASMGYLNMAEAAGMRRPASASTYR